MFKLLIASGVAVSAAVLASPAQADWNPARADGFYLEGHWSGTGWSGSAIFWQVTL